MKQKILTISNFKEGSLPVKYLGLPLISGKLAPKVCKLLANKIAARINTWSARRLSFLWKTAAYTICLFFWHSSVLEKHFYFDCKGDQGH